MEAGQQGEAVGHGEVTGVVDGQEEEVDVLGRSAAKRCSAQQTSAATTLSRLGVVVGSKVLGLCGDNKYNRRRKHKLINELSHVPPAHCEPNEGDRR
jgi:hypothetical protein